MTTPPNHNTADQSGADERAKFEAWMLTNELDESPDLERDGEYYENFDTQRAWRGWQACASTQPAPQAAQDVVRNNELEELRKKVQFAYDSSPVLRERGCYGTVLLEIDILLKSTTPQPFPAPAVQPTSGASSADLAALFKELSNCYVIRYGRKTTIELPYDLYDRILAATRNESAIVPQVVQAPIEPVHIRLNEQEASALRDLIDDSRSITQAVTLKVGDGHAGFGLYAWSTEYPDDGSWFIKSVAAPIVATVPSGWKLVPIEITEEMHVAAVRTINRCTGNDDFPRRVYAAMLNAAPSPTEQASDVRNAALEEAARCCDFEAEAYSLMKAKSGEWAVRSIANIIRKLKSAPAAKGNAQDEAINVWRTPEEDEASSCNLPDGWMRP